MTRPTADAAAPDTGTAGLLRRWLHLATDYAVLLLLVLLPLDLCFRVPGRLMYLTPWEIAKDTSVLVLLYAALALAAALIAALPTLVLNLLGPAWPRRWLALAQLSGCAVTALLLSPVASAWWQKLRASLAIPGLGVFKYLLALALIAAIGRALWRRGFVVLMNAVSARLQGGRAAVLALAGASLLLACATGHLKIRPLGWQSPPAPARAGAPPNVILIVIDALAAHDMSLYGYRLATTPALERFAGQSCVFDNYFSASNFTTASVTSLLTGRHVLSHGVQQLDGRLSAADRPHTLPQLLHDAGYTTGAVVANPLAHPLYTGSFGGFDYLSRFLQRLPAGWMVRSLQLQETKLMPVLRDVWWWPWALRYVELSHDPHVQLDTPYPPEWVTADALEFLGRAGAPYFLWAHYMPPHDPYLAPPPFRGRFLESSELQTWAEQHAEPAFSVPYDPATQQARVDLLRLRYDESLAYVDHEVGGLLQQLEQAGRFADSIIIVTADHGESFDHGFQMHAGPLLYDSLVKIPLIVHLPGQQAGARIADYSGQVDVLPTVLELLGRSAPDWAEGRSLAPLLQARPLPARAQLSMNLEFTSRFGRPRLGSFAVEARPYKFIRYEGWDCEELYDRERDPAEADNLIRKQPDVAARLRGELADRLHLQFAAPRAAAAAPCSPPRRH